MSSLEHIFLQTPPQPVPGRWQGAFADGRVVNQSELLAWLKSHSVAHSLIWLCTNPDWQAQVEAIRKAQPEARWVVLSNSPQSQEGLVALEAGARGYTHAHAVPALLQEVALVIEHGGLWVGPDLLQRLVKATHQALSQRANPEKQAASTVSKAAVLSSLSAREAEVAGAVASGHSNKEVADMLHISERTVKAHLGKSFEKLGVRDRLQLTLLLAGEQPAKVQS